MSKAEVEFCKDTHQEMLCKSCQDLPVGETQNFDYLNVQDIDFRVGSVIPYQQNGEQKVAVIILAYKDSRVDMDYLDKKYPNRWRNSFYRDEKNGALVCKIEVYDEKIGEWIGRENVGTPSNNEKEKGEYSDAIKRAGTMWGCGRELYKLPTLFCVLNENEWYEKGGKYKVVSKFRPNDWEWSIDWKEDPSKSTIVGKDKTSVRVKVN